jgi:hypothetical protein
VSIQNFIRALIITVIALIVAAMLVPNFIGGNRKGAPVSRVKNDMRSMATGIESYFVDEHAYPPMQPMRDFVHDEHALRRTGGIDMSTVRPGDASLAGITTPVAYVTTMFHDPFAPLGNLSFGYYTDGPSWILISPGPDGDYDMNHPDEVFTSKEDQPSTRVILMAYDPTNGTTSSGDVWRVHQ